MLDDFRGFSCFILLYRKHLINLISLSVPLQSVSGASGAVSGVYMSGDSVYITAAIPVFSHQNARMTSTNNSNNHIMLASCLVIYRDIS